MGNYVVHNKSENLLLTIDMVQKKVFFCVTFTHQTSINNIIRSGTIYFYLALLFSTWLHSKDKNQKQIMDTMLSIRTPEKH